MAAKLLFVLAFVSLPLLISDCVVLHARGFPPIDHLPGLLWRHALLFVPLVLSAATIASSVTRNLWQFVLWPIGLVLIGIISDLFDKGDAISGGSVPMSWIEDTIQEGRVSLDLFSDRLATVAPPRLAGDNTSPRTGLSHYEHFHTEFSAGEI